MYTHHHAIYEKKKGNKYKIIISTFYNKLFETIDIKKFDGESHAKRILKKNIFKLKPYAVNLLEVYFIILIKYE